MATIPHGFTADSLKAYVLTCWGDDDVTAFLHDATFTCGHCRKTFVTEGPDAVALHQTADGTFCEDCADEYRFDPDWSDAYSDARQHGTLWAYSGSVVG
jgi:hypothetical protein